MANNKKGWWTPTICRHLKTKTKLLTSHNTNHNTSYDHISLSSWSIVFLFFLCGHICVRTRLFNTQHLRAWRPINLIDRLDCFRHRQMRTIPFVGFYRGILMVDLWYYYYYYTIFIKRLSNKTITLSTVHTIHRLAWSPHARGAPGKMPSVTMR